HVRKAADETMGANAQELVHTRIAAKNRPIFDDHMATDGGIVGEDHVVTDVTIMGYVGVGQKQVVRTDTGKVAAQRRTAMNCDALTRCIVIADFKRAGFAFVLQVGRVLANRGKLENAVASTDAGRTAYHYMRGNFAAITDLHLGAYD